MRTRVLSVGAAVCFAADFLLGRLRACQEELEIAFRYGGPQAKFGDAFAGRVAAGEAVK